MEKIAVFVEGHTELLFVDELVCQVAGRHNVQLEHREIRGGATVPRRVRILSSAPAAGQEYYVLIVDCGGDNQVKTRILEEHENLTRSGFVRIIGIRDVKPEFTRADIPRLEQGLRMYIRTSLIPVDFVLGVMEIEAWFLAEHTHFPRIESSITVARIAATLGFDPEHDDMSYRNDPADDLDASYQLGGKRYKKGDSDVIGALDFTEVYLNVATRAPQLDKLLGVLDAFLG